MSNVLRHAGAETVAISVGPAAERREEVVKIRGAGGSSRSDGSMLEEQPADPVVSETFEEVAMTRESALPFLALAAPPAVAGIMTPFRDDIANTNVALVMVLVVVAVATGGDRAAGIVAALSSALWFDLLLTSPYGLLTITARADVETTVLLLLIGIAVTELTMWGRRQQARAVRAEAWTEGIRDATEWAGPDASPSEVVEQVRQRLPVLLKARSCRFDSGAERLGGSRPRLRPDGEIEVDGAVCDVERYGLPLEREIEVMLVSGGDYLGRFLITATPDARPSLAQRLAALTLTDRAAAALALPYR